MKTLPGMPATALALMTFFAGCATAPDPAAADAPRPEAREYRTGSNIPVHDPVPLTPEEKEKQRDDARKALDKLLSTPQVKHGS